MTYGWCCRTCDRLDRDYPHLAPHHCQRPELVSSFIIKEEVKPSWILEELDYIDKVKRERS